MMNKYETKFEIIYLIGAETHTAFGLWWGRELNQLVTREQAAHLLTLKNATGEPLFRLHDGGPIV